MSNTRITLLCWLIAAIGMALVATVEAQETPLFDATLYEEVDHPLAGMREITVLYKGGDFNMRGEHPGLPAHEKVEELAHENVGTLTVLDIEHWQTNMLWGGDASEEEVERNIDKMVQIARWMHQAEPGIRIGYYSKLPVTPGHSLDDDGNYERHDRAMRESRRMMRLAREVDVIFPSVYVKRTEFEDWRRMADWEIEAAAIYNKPIYPFIWPVYSGQHRDEDLQGEPIPPAKFQRMLDHLRGHPLVDGVVVWGKRDGPTVYRWYEIVDLETQ